MIKQGLYLPEFERDNCGAGFICNLKGIKSNQIIHDACQARENVHLVPLYETFLGHGSHCRQFWRATYRSDDPHFWFYTNIEDPNDRGYDAIRR